MTAVSADDVIGVEDEAPRMWWVFLVAGIAWVVLSFLVLALDPGRAAVIGYLTAFVLIAAGVNEFVDLAYVEGWKWLHGLLGALFAITGILALLEPFQTFGILALLIGWYLLFRGTFAIIFSIMDRAVLPLWGLWLALGIIEVLIGLWAIGYPGRSAALLILWVGVGALTRGIAEILFAFRLKDARPL